jgi:transcription antitermination factor NusG
MSDPAWYCVHTKSKCEHLAAAALRMIDGIDTYCPRIRFQRSTPRGKVWFIEALFPSYFFARFDVVAHLRAVNATHNVIRVVQFGDRYIPLSDRTIEDLRVEMQHQDIREVRATLNVGDTVELTEGPMRGFTGIIDSMRSGNDRVRVLLEFLGRQSLVEIDAGQLLNELQPRSALRTK